MARPLISVCIPSYRRVTYLERLLKSIEIQSFQDFEIIISDDSPDNSVQMLVEKYPHLNIIFYKNTPSLGTPANWNAGIRACSGEWIKLMHDDDWFAGPDSLQIFADHTLKGDKFIFSAYTNRFETSPENPEEKYLPKSWGKKILQEPMTLLAYNVIGPPSVTLVHRSLTEQYDERLKWRVDMEFYVRVLNQVPAFTYIDQPLVNVGVSDSQVTQSCIYQPGVELPEGLLLLEKHGAHRLKNVWVYDAWWRLLRNMQIHEEKQLQTFAPGNWPPVILQMVADLRRSPRALLNFGPASKTLMFVSYLKNRRNLISTSP